MQWSAARATCRALGIVLTDIPDWVCCGSTPAHASSNSLAVALPNSRTVVLPGAGHMMMVERPDELLAAFAANHPFEKEVRVAPEQMEAEELILLPQGAAFDVLDMAGGWCWGQAGGGAGCGGTVAWLQTKKEYGREEGGRLRCGPATAA